MFEKTRNAMADSKKTLPWPTAKKYFVNFPAFFPYS
jgi:hypothetical protein